MADTIQFLTVEEEDNGTRCDRFLAGKLPDLSRSRIQELIAEGAVQIDGKTVKSSRKMMEGETVEIRIPDPEVPEIRPEAIPLDILYEDNDLLIVNKPKGMTVHPAPGHPDGTLVNAVLYHCGESLSGINGVLRPGIVHRIDKDTTGALIICKNDAAHRKIAEQLQVHSVTRIYHGIVCGVVRNDTGTIEGNIGRDPKDRKKMAVVKTGGKEAVTVYSGASGIILSANLRWRRGGRIRSVYIWPPSGTLCSETPYMALRNVLLNWRGRLFMQA